MHIYSYYYLIFFLGLFFDISNSAISLQQQGDVAMQKGEYQEAISIYTSLLGQNPSQINYSKRAQAYFNRRQYSEALRDLDFSLSLDPSFVKGLLQRSKIYSLTGDFNSALIDLQHVILKRPKSSEANKQIQALQSCINSWQNMEGFLQRRQYNEALTSLLEAENCGSDSDKVKLQEANIYYLLKDYHGAIISTGSVLKNDPNNILAYHIRGQSYYNLGEFDVSSRHFKEGLKLSPDDNTLKTEHKKVKKLLKLLENANEAILNKDYATSINLLNECISLDPNHIPLQNTIYPILCKAHSLNHNNKEAIQICSKSLSLSKDDIQVLKFRAEAYYQDKQYENAINDFQKCIDQGNRDATIQEGLRKANLALKKKNRKDYYGMLDVLENASKSEIKKKFHEKALLFHPDKYSSSSDEEKKEAEEKFRDIAEAYEILSDDESRGKYDRGEDINPQQGQQRQGNPFQGFPFNFGSHFTFHFG